MMDTNSTGMMMGGMAMTFYSSIDTTILFDDWQTHTVGQYIGALVAVMLMGLARQALVWARKQLPSWMANGYFTICSSEDSFYPLASVPLTYGTTPKATDGGAEPCCCDESADHKVSVHSGGSDDDNKSDESATAMPSAAGPSRETSVLSIEVPTPGTSNGIVARGVHKGYRDAEITSGQESKSAGPSLQYSNQAGQTQVSTGVARCVGGRLANPMQVLRSRPHLLAWLRAADALLHTIVTAVAFLNMLVAMTYNAGLFTAVCVGEGLGYYVFSPFVLVQWDGSKVQQAALEEIEDQARSGCH